MLLEGVQCLSATERSRCRALDGLSIAFLAHVRKTQMYSVRKKKQKKTDLLGPILVLR